MKKVAIATLAFMLVAPFAMAQNHGHHGPGNGGAPAGFGGHAIVGADGTLYLVRPSDTAGSVSISAVRPTGTIAWTATIADAHGRLVLSGTNLIAVNETRSDAGVVTTTLRGISTASGAVAGTRELTGHVTLIEPFSGGTYVGLVVPPATQGGAATRSLLGIGNDGSVLWTLPL